MRRSSFITWEELRVGLLLLAALAVLGIAIVKLGEAANLFTKRYALVTFLPNAAGLREGGSVTVAGQLAGVVEHIEFLAPTGDTSRNLKVTLALDERVRAQIREDSRAKLRTLGLLGDKVLDISPGTPRFAVLPPGDTVITVSTLDYEAILAQASGAVGDMVELTHDLRAITGGLVRGDGTMGQLLTSRSLYDDLSGTLSRLNTLLTRLDRRDGTLAKLVDDPSLYTHLVSVTTQLDSVLGQVRGTHGTLGRLMADDSLYTSLLAASAGADSLLRQIAHGKGLATQMLTDQDLYDKLNKTLTDLSTILADVRQHPQRYTKGMVKVFEE